MSTSCYIRVKGSDLVIYKHWDGYPAETIFQLDKMYIEYKDEFLSVEKNQALLLILVYLNDITDIKLNKMLSSTSIQYVSNTDFTGWGLYKSQDCDSMVEYEYTMNLDTGFVEFKDHTSKHKMVDGVY